MASDRWLRAVGGEPADWDVSCKVGDERVVCSLEGEKSFFLPFFFDETPDGKEVVTRIGDRYFRRTFLGGNEMVEDEVSRSDAEKIISQSIENRLGGRAV